MFSSSLVSYPNRGDGGSASWRGNCSPRFVEDFLLTYHCDSRGLDMRGLVIDPMKGSDTTGDVARRLGVPYRGFDLHEGFDAAADDLLGALDGQRAKTAFFHPPYAGMIQYSGRQYGSPDKRDLSRMSIPEFEEMLQAVLQNLARAIEPGGTYGCLVGNWRNSGRYYHMASRVIMLAPDEPCMEIIKAQHNTASGATAYSGSFVPTLHETLIVFRRAADATAFAFCDTAYERLTALARPTWRNLIRSMVRSGEVVSPKEVAERVAAHPRAATNRYVGEKVRQTIARSADLFERVGNGAYAVR